MTSIEAQERCHGLTGCFAALTTLDANPDVKLTYADVLLDIKVTPSTGHCIITVGDPAKHPKHLELSKQIAGLAALGPAAELDDPMPYIRDGDWAALPFVAKLSPEDLALLDYVDGPSGLVKLARVILATKAYYDVIGLGGKQRLDKAFKHGSNQGIHEWEASKLMPEHVARKYLAKADAQLATIMNAKDQATTSMEEVQAIMNRTRAPIKGRI